MKEHRSGEWSPALTEAEKETLFAIARDTLAWAAGGRRGKFAIDRYTITPALKEHSATFVTFLNSGDLRGCVGCLEAVEPMYLSVHRSAANAAEDSRFAFSPITQREIPEIEIHVSLLSKRRPIGSVAEFKLGEHGIWLEKGSRGAVFLPEVAVEQKWTKEETLQHLCMKAGLSPDAWKSDCTFMVFESVVFSKQAGGK